MSHYYADSTEPCAACGARRGLHKYATEACPNPEWLTAPGSGPEQWLPACFARARLPEVDPWGHQETATLQKLYTGHTV